MNFASKIFNDMMKHNSKVFFNTCWENITFCKIVEVNYYKLRWYSILPWFISRPISVGSSVICVNRTTSLDRLVAVVFQVSNTFSLITYNVVHFCHPELAIFYSVVTVDDFKWIDFTLKVISKFIRGCILFVLEILALAAPSKRLVSEKISIFHPKSIFRFPYTLRIPYRVLILLIIGSGPSYFTEVKWFLWLELIKLIFYMLCV